MSFSGSLLNSMLSKLGVRLCRQSTINKMHADYQFLQNRLAEADAAQTSQTDAGSIEAIGDRVIAHINEVFGPFQPTFARRHYDRRILFEIMKLIELGFGDVLLAINGPQFNQPPKVRIETDFPVAYDSLDHTEPFGTAADNTRGVGFCIQCEKMFGDSIRLLDLGCAGGGIVFDFLMRGHFAVGVEGSDYSQKAGRANWRLLKNHLFTADITKPFQVAAVDGRPMQFEVVTAWEVLEHLPEDRLEMVFANIHKHLVPGGIFVGTANFVESPHHVCVKPPSWWEERFQERFEIVKPLPFAKNQLPRGVNSGLFDSSDYFLQPETGFHFCLRKSA